MLIRITDPFNKTRAHLFCKENIDEEKLKDIANKIRNNINIEADSYTGDGDAYIDTKKIIIKTFSENGINPEPVPWDYEIKI